MKKAIKKTKMFTLLLFSILIMGFSQIASSYDLQNPIELKSIGKLNKQPLFQLNLNNPEAVEYLIRVKDGDGNLLYSEKLKGKNISRKYQLDINEEELYYMFTVRFEITRITTNETYIYSVTRNSRIVEDIIVAKL